MERLYSYIKAIKNNEILSCIYVKNAVSRFERDLKRPEFDFREDKIKEVLDCIAQLKHFTGEHSGNNFIAKPWQVFIAANLYGFYFKGTNQRRFNDAYIEVARKNGKTAFFGSGLGIYHLIGDGEDAAQVLLAANSKDQAHICFDLTSGFTKKFDPEGLYLKSYRSDIKFPETKSMIKVLAADSCKLDGYNASYGLIDEYHSAPDAKVKDVIESSMAMRFNPMLMVITTAGFNKDSVCYKMRTNAIEVISGVKEEDSLFSIIYTMDEEDDWKDEKNWIKSNPNIDVTVKRAFLRKQVIKATNNPSEEVGIKTKNFNVWCDASQVWIPDEYILDATRKLDINDFKDEECFIGVDLNSTDDLAAVSYEFFKDDLKYFIVKYYIPHDSLNTVANREIYKEWVRRGFLTVTPGNVTDYDYITKDICKAADLCSVYKIYYDKWNSSKWAIDCTGLGLPIEPFSQTIGNFNAPTKELQRSILSHKVVIDDNPITRYCFRNVVIKEDIHENGKPAKSNAASKIDGVISMIQSDEICVKRNENTYSGNCY
jgi:phage terminase large subunit-like protein